MAHSKLIKFILFLSAIAILLFPLEAFGQAELKSNSYSLDNLNLGSSLIVTTEPSSKTTSTTPTPTASPKGSTEATPSTSDTTAPTLSNVSTQIKQVKKSLVLTATWTTSENATTEATLRDSEAAIVPLDLPSATILTISHSLNQSQMTPNSSYELTIIAKDKAGNATQEVRTVTSPALRKSWWQIIVEFFAKIFMWFRNLFR